MNSLKLALSLAVFYLSFEQSLVSAKQCMLMRDSPYVSPCIAAGYNYTFPIPSNLSPRSKRQVGSYLKMLTNEMKNCSVAQISEAIGCALFAPNCQEGNPNPLLPCRRVCSEFLKRCTGTVSAWWIDDFMGRCTLLPNDTAASGKCYEPPQFDKHFNESSKGPFERGCQKLINFPFCENLGYEYTIPTAEGQARVYRLFYGKNITDGNREEPAPRAILQYVKISMAKHRKCNTSIHKFFCGGVMPPCFPHEGKAYYSVCQSVCKSVGQNCPEIFETRGGRYYVNCERMAEGTTSHGFCKHTSWPSPSIWEEYFTVKPTPKPKSNTWIVIVVSVVVPVVLVAVIMFIVFIILWRKKRLASMFTYRVHKDDKPKTES